MLDKSDIQGNLLRGYTFRHAAYLFFAIEQPAQARAFLRRLELTSASHWPAGMRPSSAFNVALSMRGLTQLAQPGTVLDTALLDALKQRYPAFAQGMQARAELLGDDVDCALRHADWSRVELWVSIFADERAQLTSRVEQLSKAPGLHLLFGGPLLGNALERGSARIEHFGFQDNISNPAIEDANEPGDNTQYNLGNGKIEGGVGKPLRAGEFVLGYPNESGDPVPDDALGAFVRNGTFAVFRDLKQNVGLFRDYLQRTASSLKRSPEEIGALIVGRKQSGEPLIEAAQGDRSLNDFGYQGDRDGAKCPFASHVRRTHPRDSSGVAEVSHRLLRRGMPYGPLLPERAKEDGVARGLYFVVYNACIERQFEFVQQRWVNAPTGTGLADDFDPLLCRRSASMVIPGAQQDSLPRVIDGLRGFVDLLGGGYFFVPGLSAVRALAAEVES